MKLSCRWSWECCFHCASGQIFWNSFAICWRCLFGSYFVWLPSRVWLSLYCILHALLEYVWISYFHIDFLLWSIDMCWIRCSYVLCNWAQNIFGSSKLISNWFLCWNVSLCDISMLWGYNGFLLFFDSAGWSMVLLSTLPRILGLLKTLYYKASAVICLIKNVEKLVRKNDIFFLVFFFPGFLFFFPLFSIN